MEGQIIKQPSAFPENVWELVAYIVKKVDVITVVAMILCQAWFYSKWAESEKDLKDLCKSQSQRTDKLYETVIDLLKERK